MKFDNLLKTLFYDAMPGLLRVLRCPEVTQYLTVEYPEKSKMVADVVALLANGKILHIEFQLGNDPRLHWRCYHYYGAIQEQWENREVIQIALYLGGGPMTMKAAIEYPTCNFHYQILDIRDIPAEAFLNSPTDSERVLAVLCDSDDPRETIRKILASWRHLSDKQLLDNLDRLRMLSKLRNRATIVGEEIKRMPFDIEVDMSDDLWFKEGEQKGQLKTVTRLLERLFGPSRNPRSSVLPKRPRNSLTTGTSVHTVWPAWTTFFERVDFFSPAGKTLTFLVPGSRLIQ